MAVPYFKNEYKSAFLKLPVSRSSLFGDDFEKSSDKVIKECTATAKVIRSKNFSERGKEFFRGSQQNSRDSNQFSKQNSYHFKNFRGQKNRGGHKRGRGGRTQGENSHGGGSG